MIERAGPQQTGRDPWVLLDHDLWREICPLGDWEGVLRDGSAADGGWGDELRAATYSGKPLGNQGFVKQLEKEVGGDLRVRGRGRPRKKAGLEAIMRAAVVR